MTDYWKSNERKFCDFCKCWIADNKPSIQFHENGKRHKANVAKRITEISKKSAKDERAKQKFDADLRKMNDAAMTAYLQDCARLGGDITSQINNINQPEEEPTSSTNVNTTERVKYTPKIDPLLKDLPEDFLEEEYNKRKNSIIVTKSTTETIEPKENSMWCEAVSDEGHTYYWNIKTGESVWEAPKEGFMTIAEYNKINQIAKQQQEEHMKKESQDTIHNADEIAAKFQRENLKKYRSRTVGEKKENKNTSSDEETSYKRDPDVLATEAQPYGQWETVVKEEEKPLPDLQLPVCDYYYVPPPVSTEPVAPVKEFKEKTIKTLESDVSSGDIGVFKKRKLNNAGKKNARQRLDTD